MIKEYILVCETWIYRKQNKKKNKNTFVLPCKTLLQYCGLPSKLCHIFPQSASGEMLRPSKTKDWPRLPLLRSETSCKMWNGNTARTSTPSEIYKQNRFITGHFIQNGGYFFFDSRSVGTPFSSAKSRETRIACTKQNVRKRIKCQTGANEHELSGEKKTNRVLKLFVFPHTYKTRKRGAKTYEQR